MNVFWQPNLLLIMRNKGVASLAKYSFHFHLWYYDAADSRYQGKVYEALAVERK